MDEKITIQMTETIVDLKMTAEKYRILKNYINLGQWWGKEDLNKFIDILDNTNKAPEEEKKEQGDIQNE